MAQAPSGEGTLAAQLIKAAAATTAPAFSPGVWRARTLCCVLRRAPCGGAGAVPPRPHRLDLRSRLLRLSLALPARLLASRRLLQRVERCAVAVCRRQPAVGPCCPRPPRRCAHAGEIGHAAASQGAGHGCPAKLRSGRGGQLHLISLLHLLQVARPRCPCSACCAASGIQFFELLLGDLLQHSSSGSRGEQEPVRRAEGWHEGLGNTISRNCQDGSCGNKDGGCCGGGVPASAPPGGLQSSCCGAGPALRAPARPAAAAAAWRSGGTPLHPLPLPPCAAAKTTAALLSWCGAAPPPVSWCGAGQTLMQWVQEQESPEAPQPTGEAAGGRQRHAACQQRSRAARRCCCCADPTAACVRG